MTTTVVRWTDLPRINVGRGTAYGNPVCTDLVSHETAVLVFDEAWANLGKSNPALYERYLRDIRGQRIACPGNCSFKGKPCHAVSLARMADALPEVRQ